MDIIETLFTWGIPLLVLYLLYRSKGERVRINGIFQQLARDYQGRVSRRTWFDYPSLAVDEQNFTFHLGVSLASGGDVWVTRLNMEHHQLIDFELHLQPHSRLEKLATAIGFQDAAIGTKVFNDAFLVKASNEQKAGMFMSEEIQQALIQLRGLNPELTFTKSAIVLTTSFLNHLEDYQAVANFGLLLCRKLNVQKADLIG